MNDMDEAFFSFSQHRNQIPIADQRKAVLVVEDDEQFMETLWSTLHDALPILWATSNAEAIKTFEANRAQIGIIVFDFYLHDETTLSLIHDIAPTFQGPMIAGSSSSEARVKQLAAGCTHQAEKQDVPNLVITLIAH